MSEPKAACSHKPEIEKRAEPPVNIGDFSFHAGVKRDKTGVHHQQAKGGVVCARHNAQSQWPWQ
jgi:hypothetical protein